MKRTTFRARRSAPCRNARRVGGTRFSAPAAGPLPVGRSAPVKRRRTPSRTTQLTASPSPIVTIVPRDAPGSSPLTCRASRPRATYPPPHSAAPIAAYGRNSRYRIRSPPAASGASAFSTGRNGVIISSRPPSWRIPRSAASQRASPIQAPIRPRRSRSPQSRPARKVADQPAQQPPITPTRVADAPTGRLTPTAARIAASAGTRMPTSGIASSIMISANAAPSSAVGSSVTWVSHAVMAPTLWPPGLQRIRDAARSRPPDLPPRRSGGSPRVPSGQGGSRVGGSAARDPPSTGRNGPGPIPCGGTARFGGLRDLEESC